MTCSFKINVILCLPGMATRIRHHEHRIFFKKMFNYKTLYNLYFNAQLSFNTSL